MTFQRAMLLPIFTHSVYIVASAGLCLPGQASHSGKLLLQQQNQTKWQRIELMHLPPIVGTRGEAKEKRCKWDKGLILSIFLLISW